MGRGRTCWRWRWNGATRSWLTTTAWWCTARGTQARRRPSPLRTACAASPTPPRCSVALPVCLPPMIAAWTQSYECLGVSASLHASCHTLVPPTMVRQDVWKIGSCVPAQADAIKALALTVMGKYYLGPQRESRQWLLEQAQPNQTRAEEAQEGLPPQQMPLSLPCMEFRPVWRAHVRLPTFHCTGHAHQTVAVT